MTGKNLSSASTWALQYLEADEITAAVADLDPQIDADSELGVATTRQARRHFVSFGSPCTPGRRALTY
jgi:hypothetical protein